MKKISCIALAALMSLSLVACGGSDKSSSKSASKDNAKVTASAEPTKRPHKEKVYPKGTYTVNKDSAKLIGRTYIENDILWISYSGSGCEFKFKGKACEIMLMGDTNATKDNHSPRFAVYVDDTEVARKNMTEAVETINCIETVGVEEHIVRVVKLSESSDSTMGIVKVACDEEGVISPTEEKSLKIEFIGDSITCGYGVDEPLGGVYSTANEDCTKAYAIKAAKLLDADYSLVSFSGYGIVSGYTSGEKNTISTLPQYYDKFGNSYGSFLNGVKPSDIEWDFSFKPDVVVINLGTNDDSYCKGNAERKEEYTVGYVDFIKQIREKNPDAKIVCTLGLMGNALFPQIQDAVGRYIEETGDENVYAFQLDNQDSGKGYAVDYHPVEENHAHAAEQIAEFIKSIK